MRYYDTIHYEEDPPGVDGSGVYVSREEVEYVNGIVYAVKTGAPRVMVAIMAAHAPLTYPTPPERFEFFAGDPDGDWADLGAPLEPLPPIYAGATLVGTAATPLGANVFYAYLYVVDNPTGLVQFQPFDSVLWSYATFAAVGLAGVAEIGSVGGELSTPADMSHTITGPDATADQRLWIMAGFPANDYNFGPPSYADPVPTRVAGEREGSSAQIIIAGADDPATSVDYALSDPGNVLGLYVELLPVESPAIGDATLVLAGAASGAVAGGVILSQPGEVIPPIAVHILDRSNPWWSLGTLDDSFARTFQDQVSEAGAGSVSLDNRDPALATIDENTMLRFELNGLAQLTVIPKTRTQVSVAPGEEHDQITTLSGPGSLALLAEAVVYPSRGVGSLPIEEDRVFSWPSPDFDDSGWVAATEIVRQDSSSQWWMGLPNEPFWPSPSCFWLWAHQGSELSAPQGTCYFRRTFDVAEQAKVVIFFTIDDSGMVYIDGMRLSELDVGSRNEVVGPTEIRYTYVTLSAGEHVIAVEGNNSPPNPLDDPEESNPAGFLLAVWSMDPDGSLGSEMLLSDSEWVMVEYPPTPPGMTPGRVVEILMAEAIPERGVMYPGVFLMFDDEVDSNGNPWPVVGDISTKVGTDYLTFIREMAGTYFDVWMAPGGFELYLFSLDQQGSNAGIVWHPPSDAEDPSTGNVDHLVHTRAT